MSLRSRLILSLTEGLGPVLSARLIERAGSVDGAVEASRALIRSIPRIGPKTADSIFDSMRAAHDLADRELNRASRLGIDLIDIDDDRYPALLKSTATAPGVLWLRGTLEPRDLHAIAIVGSRRCSVYGREQAERFGLSLASNGITVVSGGARGIDSSAHVGALRAVDGRTLAVLGCGVDRPYPPENAGLFEKIIRGGALLSDFAIGTPPLAEHFPRRNRIISGLSRGTLVIEADLKSGALITARYAFEEHARTVFALPGRVDNPLSAGPHRLIRDGAVLVETVADLIDHIGPVPASVSEPGLFATIQGPPAEPTDTSSMHSSAVSSKRSTKQTIALTEADQAIIESIRIDSLDADAIAERTGKELSEVLSRLTRLTIRGLVVREEAGRYKAKG
jgi:DNA processing protein